MPCRTWLPMYLLLLTYSVRAASYQVTSPPERALSRSTRLLALLQALRCRRHAVTAAALAREL